MEKGTQPFLRDAIVTAMILCHLLKEQATSRLLFIDSSKRDPMQSRPAIGINGNTTAFSNLICLCSIRFLRDNPPDMCLSRRNTRHSLIIRVPSTFAVIFDVVTHM